MADIVEQLRMPIAPFQSTRSIEGILHIAADEIGRLREREAELQAQCGYTDSIKTLEIERLRAALKSVKVVAAGGTPIESTLTKIMQIADEALTSGQGVEK